MWFNVFSRRLRPFSIFIGGRGCGKTYSALYGVIEKREKFIYLRNTATQLAECIRDFGNPFKRLNLDNGWDVKILKEEQHGIIQKTNDDGKTETIGYAAALSTFSNLRGVDLSDVTIVVFDEFIERRKLSFDQFSNFFDFYETVNRNREMMGKPPLIVILLSNSQKLANPILAGLGLIPTIENMFRNSQSRWATPEIYLELITTEEFTAKKQNTVLYRVTHGTAKSREALDNEFALDSFYGIGKKPIVEYIGYTNIDNLYIYRHKSNGTYYVSNTPFHVKHNYVSKDDGLEWCKLYAMEFRTAAVNGLLSYQDFAVKTKFLEILKIY